MKKGDQNIMEAVGGLFVVLGGLSAVLAIFDMNLEILLWVDNWGYGTGWIIRIAVIAIGIVLWVIGKRQSR